jgi:hypothetical protein
MERVAREDGGFRDRVGGAACAALVKLASYFSVGLGPSGFLSRVKAWSISSKA